MTFIRQTAAIRHAETKRGDTLQDIALRELGDAARWHDIATLNNLIPPWITDDLEGAGPRVLLAGQQTILVPSSAPPAAGVVDPESVFGTDIVLLKGRLTGNAMGGIATVSGADNLKSALARRIASPGDELRFHPEYGCLAHSLIGKGGTRSATLLAASFVARALRSDPRVARVTNTVATITGDVLAVTSVAVAIDGKKVPVGTS